MCVRKNCKQHSQVFLEHLRITETAHIRFIKKGLENPTLIFAL